MSSRFLRLALVIGLAVPAVSGCAMTHPLEPEPTLLVEAEIASVTLGDDCAARGAPGLWAGDCAESDGCGFCQQTAIQLHLAAIDPDPAGAETVPVEVMSIRLLDEAGTVVGSLAPHDLLIWSASDGAYLAWDGTITSGEEIDVSVPTNAPDWAAIGGTDAWSTYGMEFEVDLTLRVDGADRELDFAPATREAAIVT